MTFERIGRVTLAASLMVVAVGALGGAATAAPHGKGTPKLTPACVAAKAHYVLDDENKFDRVADLYGDNVDYIGPDGKRRSSHAEIAAFIISLGSNFSSINGGPIRLKMDYLLPARDGACVMAVRAFSYKTKQFDYSVVQIFKVDSRGKIMYFRPYYQTRSSFVAGESRQ